MLNTTPFDTSKPWLITHRSKRSLIPLLLWGFLATGIAYIYSVNTPAIRVPDLVPYIGGLRLATLWLLPISVFLEAIRRFYNDLYIFDSKGITHHKGRLSLKYSLPLVKYTHIRAITVTQSILGRILGYGTVSFGTAAEEGNELTVVGIRDPRGLAKAVDYLRLDIDRMTNKKEVELREHALDMAS